MLITLYQIIHHYKMKLIFYYEDSKYTIVNAKNEKI